MFEAVVEGYNRVNSIHLGGIIFQLQKQASAMAQGSDGAFQKFGGPSMAGVAE